MKKTALILLVFSFNIVAEEGYERHENHRRSYEGGYRGERHGDGDDWILPAIVGGVILGGAAYGYSRPPAPPPPTYYYPPTPVYQQAPPIYPAVPYGYHQQSVFDPNCNCYKYALVPN